MSPQTANALLLCLSLLVLLCSFRLGKIAQKTLRSSASNYHAAAQMDRNAAQRHRDAERLLREGAGLLHQHAITPTMVEIEMTSILNGIKAWRDSEGNEPFPHQLRERMDAALKAVELRRGALTPSNSTNLIVTGQAVVSRSMVFGPRK